MKFDGILFDKDGTLLDFDAFWISISHAALKRFLGELEREDIPLEALMNAMGVQNGKTDPDAILLKGTYADMGKAIHRVLEERGCALSQEQTICRVEEIYTASVEAGEILPTCQGLADALKLLHEAGVRMAVVTSDNKPMTLKCLRVLGIEEYFEVVYSADGEYPHKPDPFCALDFCRRTGIAKERLLMVGDTLTDVEFARNAEIAVYGVASEGGKRAFLAPRVDCLMQELRELPALIG